VHRATTRRPRLRRSLTGALLGAALLAGTGAAAGERTLVWSSRADFEQNDPGVPGPTARFNLDTASHPDSVTLAALQAGPAAPEGPAVRIATGLKATLDPALVALPKKREYLALWLDLRRGQPTILGRRLDARGAPLGKPIALGSGEARQSSPCAAVDEQSGSVLVAWVDGRNLGTAIYARKILPSGAPAGPETLVSEQEYNTGGPDVAWNPVAREFLVAWQSGTYDILARRVTAAGRPAGPVIRVCAAEGLQHGARVAYRAASGDYLVAWTDRRSGNDDIFWRAVSADGSLPKEEVQLRSGAQTEILAAVVANAGDGEFLLVWEDYRNVPSLNPRPTMGEFLSQLGRIPGNEVDLYARRLDGAGTPLGPETAVSAARANQLQARGAFLPATRQYLIVWDDGRNGYGDWDLYGTLAAADGTVGPEFVITDAALEQLSPRLACLGEPAECLVAWLGAAGGAHEIAAQRLARPAGAVGVLGGVRVAAGPGARWGALSWTADLPPGARLAFRTRSGKDETALGEAAWSPDLTVPGDPVVSPPGAWLEIEARLASGDGKSAPVLHDFSVRVEED
jgi:hypothetical protein